MKSIYVLGMSALLFAASSEITNAQSSKAIELANKKEVVVKGYKISDRVDRDSYRNFTIVGDTTRPDRRFTEPVQVLGKCKETHGNDQYDRAKSTDDCTSIEAALMANQKNEHILTGSMVSPEYSLGHSRKANVNLNSTTQSPPITTSGRYDPQTKTLVADTMNINGLEFRLTSKR